MLPGGSSDWTYIRAGVSQSSILGPFLFLLYINDIVTDIGSNIRLFADDTSLFIIVNDQASANDFQPSKGVAFLISRRLIRPNYSPLFMENIHLVEVDFHKHLGLYFSQDCSWHKKRLNI